MLADFTEVTLRSEWGYLLKKMNKMRMIKSIELWNDKRSYFVTKSKVGEIVKEVRRSGSLWGSLLMQVRGSCLWWQPERDEWEEGPKVKIMLITMRMRMITLRKIMQKMRSMIMPRTTIMGMMILGTIIMGMMMMKITLKCFRWWVRATPPLPSAGPIGEWLVTISLIYAIPVSRSFMFSALHLPSLASLFRT